MYIAYNIATTIKMILANKKMSIKQMLDDLELGKNFMVHMAKGNMPASDSLAKIADYLNVSVDYLLGRTDKPEINK